MKNKIIPSQLTQIDVLNPSVKLFRFSFEEPFKFLAGQFVMLHLTDAQGKPVKRAYSIASSPRQDQFIELCIRKVPGGAATTILHDMKVGEKINMAGPLGKFSLDEKIKRDVVFVAGGTGIAPIRSMLQTLPIKKLKTKFWFYFGINSLDDYLFEEELKEFTRLDNFKMILVVKEDSRWKGETGFVSEAVMKKQTPDLADKEIYMCGPPVMLRFIKAYLPHLKGKPEQIHIDAWE